MLIDKILALAPNLRPPRVESVMQCRLLRVLRGRATSGDRAFEIHSLLLGYPMIPIARHIPPSTGISRIGSQPIALAAATLLLILAGGGIALWRAHTGSVPESDRVVATRQLQARATQASEQLVENTKGLAATQQESIDQLQMVQDQLQTMRRMLAAQQSDAKRLSDQVSGLTEAVEGLRQSFASVQPSEVASSPAARNHAVRSRAHAHSHQTAQPKSRKSRG